MLTEALIALAAAGGTSVVQAAGTDAWATAKAGMARLLARGQPRQVTIIEGRLEDSQAQLTSLSGQPLQEAQQGEAKAWATRLRDVLDEDPDAAHRLQKLLEDLTAEGVTGVTSAGDHGFAVSGDSHIEASHGGVGAGVIHGSVSTGNPSSPRPTEG
jgi:hypothetical protein